MYQLKIFHKKMDEDNVESSVNDPNTVMPVSTGVRQSLSSNEAVDAFKGQIREYVLKWKADGKGDWFHINDIDDVRHLFSY